MLKGAQVKAENVTDTFSFQKEKDSILMKLCEKQKQDYVLGNKNDSISMAEHNCFASKLTSLVISLKMISILLMLSKILRKDARIFFFSP